MCQGIMTAARLECTRREVYSKIELESALKKLRIAFEVESIQTAVSIIELQAKIL